MSRQLSFALLLLACSATIGTTNASEAASGLTQLAQAQTEPSQPAAPATAAPDPATPDATAADAPEEPIGNVATVTGSASVIRNDKTTPLKVKDDIYLNDVVQTGAEFRARHHLHRQHHLQSQGQHKNHHRQLRL